MRGVTLLKFSFAMMVGCQAAAPETHSDLEKQVTATELAFAKTMADRDMTSFSEFVSDEAVFFSGQDAIRGREKIIAQWAGFFKGTAAPFSWSPDHVEVLDSGQLALSSGPVIGADGKLIARFNSIWRRESSGRWKIVFDKGCDICSKCTAQ